MNVQISFGRFAKKFAIIGCAVALSSGALTWMFAQQPADFLGSVDADKDGFITRSEFASAMSKWTGNRESLTEEQLGTVLDSAFPESAFAAVFVASGPQNQTPKQSDVDKMMAALPESAPAKPKKPRKVLVLSKAAGFVHSCIPLAAKTIEELGAKTGAWTATVTYDSASINSANLKQYDLVFLNNTTGEFLDDPKDPAATAARKKALLDFVRSGKGLAGIHAAGDSYHKATGGTVWGHMLAPGIMKVADTDGDHKVTTAELNTLAGTWFDKMDSHNTGKLSQQDFRGGFRGRLFSTVARAAATPGKGRPGRDTQVGTWPEFDKAIGGFFKYHWLDPQHIVYKIDDPDSPLTTMFRDGFEINDETYTFGMDTWSRNNLHVLTSIDYSKMSEADKLKEDFPREDHDYGLSWIHRVGKGRVFYEAHGHSERVYAMKPMLEHVLAGVQYALGDLKANDTPSAKLKK